MFLFKNSANPSHTRVRSNIKAGAGFLQCNPSRHSNRPIAKIMLLIVLNVSTLGLLNQWGFGKWTPLWVSMVQMGLLKLWLVLGSTHQSEWAHLNEWNSQRSSLTKSPLIQWATVVQISMGRNKILTSGPLMPEASNIQTKPRYLTIDQSQNKIYPVCAEANP